MLVVDGSKDMNQSATALVCKANSVDYYPQEFEGGRAAARNEALELCNTDYIAYIDDDTLVSRLWYRSIEHWFEHTEVVGVTGRLEGESLEFSGIAGKIREFLFGGRDRFGEVLDNGVINGDFFYNEIRNVDHMPGCNMAFDVETLRNVGGFDADYDVGNAYREETGPAYRVSAIGRIVYDPLASVNHLGIDEEGDVEQYMFYSPYLTRYCLRRNGVVSGVRNRCSYLLNTLARHSYFAARSLAGRNTDYLYYLRGEIHSFIDFTLLDRTPREHV